MMEQNILDAHVQEWAAIRTGARWEKKLADCLQCHNLPVYLPTIPLVKSYKRGKRVNHLPLFPGYIFFDYAMLPELDRLGDTRKKIAQILRSREPAVLRDELIEVSNVLSDCTRLQGHVFARVGDQVRIRQGNFKDYNGTIVRQVPKRRKVMVSISFLGLETTIELDDAIVERAS